MDRSDLRELHYITLISNVASILQLGILCFRKAQRHSHFSLAMPEIQAIRSKRIVPAGRPLHDYANLYFTARNPMLFKRKASHAELCVLRVSPEVLDLPGVIVTDGNAASFYTGFWPSPAGLDRVDRNLVFAEYWTDHDQITAWRKKRIKCAEVLVPDFVDSRYVLGAYVSCKRAKDNFEAAAPNVSVTTEAHLFFM